MLGSSCVYSGTSGSTVYTVVPQAVLLNLTFIGKCKLGKDYMEGIFIQKHKGSLVIKNQPGLHRVPLPPEMTFV